MPVQEFALDAVGNYVQVFFSDESENVTILLNRSIIGVIPSREELRATRAFVLQDGSLLRVQLVETQLQVFRGGQRLSQTPYGAQQPDYGYGTPPVQAAPLPLGEAIGQLPRQYIKVIFTKWSAATFGLFRAFGE